MRTAADECDCGFQSAVAAAHDENVFAAEILRIVKTVVNFFKVLPRTTKLAVISTAADGDDDAAGTRYRFFLIAMAQKQLAALAFDALDSPVGNFDAGGPPLFFHFGEQIFLYVRFELQTAFEPHFRRIRVDRFCLWKIRDCGKNLRRFEDLVAQSGLLGFDCRGNSRHACANNCEVKRLGISVSRSLKIGLLQNRANSTRTSIR